MRAGWPDMTFAYHGRACAWEVKFGGNDTSPEQKKTLAEMAAPPNNWHVAVIRTVEEAKKFLDEIEHNSLAGEW